MKINLYIFHGRVFIMILVVTWKNLPFGWMKIWATSWEDQQSAYAKTKTQIRTAKLISAFVFSTWIVQSLFFFNPKFQASSLLLWLYRPVCVRPSLKPRRPVFSHRGSFIIVKSCLFYTWQDIWGVFISQQYCDGFCGVGSHHFLFCKRCFKWINI